MRNLPLAIGLVALLAAAAAPAHAEAPAAERFLKSEAAERLRALQMEILSVTPMEGQDLLVAYYVPDQGGLNEWDEETRFNLYRPEGTAFKAVQFIGKPGKLFPGRLRAWRLEDLDGDGWKEIIGVSVPGGLANKVRSVIFRRTGSDAKFKDVWNRLDVGAALRAEGPRLTYTFIDRKANRQRRFEHFDLVDGEYRRRSAE